jgi:adenine-specific DNA methylase
LKTRWLAKKDHKRVLLTMTPNAERAGVVFGVENNVPLSTISRDRPSPNTRGASGLPRYGIDQRAKVFTDRQKMAIGEFVSSAINLHSEMDCLASPAELTQAVRSYVALCISRVIDRGSTVTTWDMGH